jgi:hypothetical protein
MDMIISKYLTNYMVSFAIAFIYLGKREKHKEYMYIYRKCLAKRGEFDEFFKGLFRNELMVMYGQLILT